MFETFRNAWKIEDLRKKLLYTLLVIVIFRLGCAIPVPFIAPEALQGWVAGQSGSMLGYIDMLTGGSFSRATLFALSVTPYINASIIIQLLTVAIPALERLSKEGEDGRKKLTRITRYTGAGIALALGIGYYFLLRGQGALVYGSGAQMFAQVFSAIVVILAFTAGSLLIQWLGEQIDVKGIGNGISILIFAGIVSRWTSIFTTIKTWLGLAAGGEVKYYFLIPVLVVLAVAVVVFIVILNAAERRIPVQYAKRVVGRKMYGGQSTHIPIKVNMSGVMPVIFASALASIPGTIGGSRTCTMRRTIRLPLHSCGCSAPPAGCMQQSICCSSLRSTISMWRCSITLWRSPTICATTTAPSPATVPVSRPVISSPRCWARSPSSAPYSWASWRSFPLCWERLRA